MRSPKILAVIALSCNLSSGYALPDLLDIYQQALANDQTFKQAYGTYMSAREAVPQATAALLPTISGSGFTSLVHLKSDINAATSTGTIPITNEDTYRQRYYEISLTQPVLNFELWLTLEQADYSVKQALSTFNDAAQSLIIRTATAYFDVLQAKDNVRFARSQLRANGRSLDQAKQRFKVGLDAITSVYEAQAAYDSSRSDLIAAKNSLKNMFESLQILTNHSYKALAPLKNNNVPLVRPQPSDIDAWTDKALKQNNALKSSHFSVLAAKKNISIQNAGHLPSLSFTSSYTHNDTQPSNVLNKSDTQTTTYKLDLTVPIYQGGLVVSQSRQASYEYQATYAGFENTYRTTLVNTRTAYNSIMDGISRIRADRQAVLSAKNSLESTNAQFKVGTRTMVDVVTSQKNLFDVQTTLAADQYSYILAILQLKYQAGTLSSNDLQEINHWLTTNRAYGPEIAPKIKRSA